MRGKPSFGKKQKNEQSKRGIGELTMDEKKRIKYIDTSKAVEITDTENLEQSKSDIWDMIREAQELALKEGIKANSIVINKKFVKVPSVWVNICGSPRELPPMICGLECYFTDNELPDNYSFAILEKPQTERERLISQAKAEKSIEILKEIGKMWDENNDYQFKDYAWFEKICKKHGVDEAIYGKKY
jgi:hypothetical protein